MLTFNRDANGLIVQTDGDGGDTAGREGDYWFREGLIKDAPAYNILYKRSETFKEVITKLQVSPGVFVRNPVHYNDPKDFSRDQTVPLILAMGELGEHATLRQLLLKQVLNFGRYQNGDLGLIGDLGYYIRGLRAWWAYPILLVGDLQLLVNSVIRCTLSHPNDVSDDINHTLILLQAQNIYATPISWAARLIYKWFRPKGIQRAWDLYFRPETNANPFNELYRGLIGNM